jgi:hypothetical protein
MSGLAPKADIGVAAQQVRLVPIADIMGAFRDLSSSSQRQVHKPLECRLPRLRVVNSQS